MDLKIEDDFYVIPEFLKRKQETKKQKDTKLDIDWNETRKFMKERFPIGRSIL